MGKRRLRGKRSLRAEAFISRNTELLAATLQVTVVSWAKSGRSMSERKSPELPGLAIPLPRESIQVAAS